MKRCLAALLIGSAILFAAVQPVSTQTADVIRGPGESRISPQEPLRPTPELIASLGAAEFRDRELATLQLLMLGVPALTL